MRAFLRRTEASPTHYVAETNDDALVRYTFGEGSPLDERRIGRAVPIQ